MFVEAKGNMGNFPKLDPTCEFSMLFDEMRLVEAFPWAVKLLNSIQTFTISVYKDAIVSPLYNFLTKYLNNHINRHSEPSTTLSDPFLDENTPISSVNSSRKHLNVLIQRGDLDSSDLMRCKVNFLVRITDILKQKSLKDLELTASHLEKRHTMNSQSLERFTLIHFVNQEVAPRSKYCDFLVNLKLHSKNLKALLKRLESVKLKFSTLDAQIVAQFPNDDLDVFYSESASRSATLVNCIEMTDQALDFCDFLIDFENLRNDVTDLTPSIIEKLEIVAFLKKSLDDEGSVFDSINDIQKRLESLKLNDSVQSVKRLVKKAQGLMESTRTITDPIFSICDEVIKYADGTAFERENIELMIKCNDDWKTSRQALKTLSSLSKDLSTEKRQPSLVQLILKESQTLKTSALALLLDLQNMSSFKEVNSDVKLEQQKGTSRNVTAINVLLKIKGKLEGKDNVEKRSQSVEEQVDYLIKQAVSVDNLASMYEGWMSWI